MADAIDFVKSEILGFFKERKAEAGHALHTPAFYHQRMSRWNPKQKDSLNPAIQQLVSEGLAEFKNETVFLTENGVNHIYPEVGNSVRQDILGFFAASKADVGYVLHAQAFYHQRMSHWNPKQHKAFEKTVNELAEEGLIEIVGDNITLTKRGVDSIY
jgi:hypothetical protein